MMKYLFLSFHAGSKKTTHHKRWNELFQQLNQVQWVSAIRWPDGIYQHYVQVNIYFSQHNWWFRRSASGDDSCYLSPLFKYCYFGNDCDLLASVWLWFENVCCMVIHDKWIQNMFCNKALVLRLFCSLKQAQVAILFLLTLSGWMANYLSIAVICSTKNNRDYLLCIFVYAFVSARGFLLFEISENLYHPQALTIRLNVG